MICKFLKVTGIHIFRTLTPQNQKKNVLRFIQNKRKARKEQYNTNENEHNEQSNKSKKQKGALSSNLEVADFVVSKKVKNSTKLFAFANDRKTEGNKGLANFVLCRSGKS